MSDMAQISEQSQPVRLESVQALRGIAAMLVLCLHIALFQRQFLPSDSVEYAITRGFWDRGGNGVDLFFVISGFIMVYVTRDLSPSLTSLRQFLWARITRIYPLWWVCAAILAVYFWISYGIPAAPDRPANAGSPWLYTFKSLLLIPQETRPILGLGWTLIHEMFFYIIFAIALLFQRKALVWILLGWACFTLAVPLILKAAAFSHPVLSHPAFYLAISPMSLEFICGAWAALLFLKSLSKPINKAVCWTLITVVLVYVCALMQTGFVWQNMSEAMSRTCLYAVPASLMVFTLSHLEATGRLSIAVPWRILGDWSYALYLTHWIVLITMRRLLREFEPYLPDVIGNLLMTERDGALNNIIFAAVAIGICLIVAWIFHRFIERPSLAYFRRRT